ncbi:MAG: hypothetical protein L6R41_008433 [Letrouitia leprolyta]|nr:MAG: hypothetical protein L6R41_008433 [Letrouitia leprolyta]
MSSPLPSSPVNAPPSAGSSTARPSSPPGGAKTAIRRKAAADRADKVANARPASTRAAGAGGSTSTMLRLYTDESPGLKVDPVVSLQRLPEDSHRSKDTRVSKTAVIILFSKTLRCMWSNHLDTFLERLRKIPYFSMAAL